MIYTFYNPTYSGGKFIDFVSVEAKDFDEAWWKSECYFYKGYSLWSITKGITISDFKIPARTDYHIKKYNLSLELK